MDKPLLVVQKTTVDYTLLVRHGRFTKFTISFFTTLVINHSPAKNINVFQNEVFNNNWIIIHSKNIVHLVQLSKLFCFVLLWIYSRNNKNNSVMLYGAHSTSAAHGTLFDTKGILHNSLQHKTRLFTNCSQQRSLLWRDLH